VSPKEKGGEGETPREAALRIRKLIEESSAPEAAQERDASALEFLSFRLGEETYALPLRNLDEILPLPTISPVPFTPSYLLGVVAHRGGVLPVVDVRPVLGIEEGQEESEGGRLLVVMHGNEKLGVLAEAVAQIVKLTEDSLAPPPETLDPSRAAYLRGTAEAAEGPLVVLDVPALFEALRPASEGP
jgi:purine-binding chemotaxis protein CheW